MTKTELEQHVIQSLIDLSKESPDVFVDALWVAHQLALQNSSKAIDMIKDILSTSEYVEESADGLHYRYIGD